MNKIIFSDYDGTLYTDDTSIINNIKMIKKFQKKNNLFVIATGRSYYDFKEMLKKYKIPYDYLILNHGSIILDSNLNIIKSYSINKDIVKEILSLAKENKRIYETVLFDALDKYVKEDTTDIIKIMLKTKFYETATKLSNFMNKNYKNNVKSYIIKSKNHYLIEIIAIETDKSKAIEEVLKRENIEKQNVYTIGDGSNDVEMIRDYSGYGMTKSEDIVYKTTNKLYDSVSDLIKDIIEKKV